MQKIFTAVYQKRAEWYVAWVEEVPGANSQGKTLEEARENLQEALALVVETNRMLMQKEADGSFIREPISVSL